MKKITALFSFLLLAPALPFLDNQSGSGGGGGSAAWLGPVRAWAAPPQAKQPQWKSRDEYDAFQAMAGEKDPRKKISLAEAFLQKFTDTDFKDLALVNIMAAHQQLGESEKAIEAGQKALEANPDNLQALSYVNFVFPFVFKSTDPDADSKLARAESRARHGLELLQKLQKPEGVTDEQFTQYVKGQRAAEDAPNDPYTFYRLGVAYVSREPRDYDNAVWNLARSSALAKASQNPAEPEISKYLRQVYINYHGNAEGLPEVTQQAAASPTPPEGFKVTPMQIPEKTGNPNIDAFNELSVPLKLGGERAQKVWDGLKGQPLGLGGFVDSIEKGADSKTVLVRIDLLESSKAADGVYDIELRDTTQPNAKNLAKGEAVRFQGTIEAYTVTPNFVMTLDGTIIDPDPLPTEPAVKPTPKPKPKPAARRPRT
jgi:tetratricopeptide (TPR) repeat protein